MDLKRSVVSTALVTAMGTGAALVPATAFAVLADGSWALTIVPTPTFAGTYVTSLTKFNIGKEGSWQSSFTFGALPSSMSNGMTDNGVLLNGGKGSSIAGDGFAGIVALEVSGGSISVLTNGGLMTGSVDGAGNMSFTPTGRLGSINSPVMIDNRWNVDDFTTPGWGQWSTFSTGSATAGSGTINGSALANAGDLDGDAIDDFSGVLVSGGQVGSGWSDFFSATYYEVWRVNILSGTAATGFNVDTIFSTAGGDFAQYASAVPVPAAVWLFGSGLMGLVGVARRKKAWADRSQ